MDKTPIGIIDMGVENLSILNYLSKAFKYEDFIYINDLEVPEYEGLAEDVIQKRIEANVEKLLSFNVKLIIVVSNTIIEYHRNYFNEISVPVVNIVDTIIDYINDNYEHKNMAFIATENIINANLYQKYFKYNHLYNLVSDSMEEFLTKNLVKTNESFNLTRELIKTVIKKDLSIIIPSSFNMMLIETEINEFLPNGNILNINEIMSDKIKAALLAIENFSTKKLGKTTIIINVSKKDFKYTHLLDVKYKLITSFVKKKKVNEIDKLIGTLD